MPFCNSTIRYLHSPAFMTSLLEMAELYRTGTGFTGWLHGDLHFPYLPSGFYTYDSAPSYGERKIRSVKDELRSGGIYEAKFASKYYFTTLYLRSRSYEQSLSFGIHATLAVLDHTFHPYLPPHAFQNPSSY